MQPYQYIARITRACELIGVEPLVSVANNVGEIVVNSKFYDTQEACMEDCEGFIGTIGTLLQQITDKKFILVTKINPLYDGSGNEDLAREEGWASNTVLRLYAAEAKPLKKENKLVFTCHANLNINQSHIDSTQILGGRSTH